MLFLPFVSRASEQVGKRLLLKIDESEYVLSFNKKILTNSFNNKIIENGSNVKITILNNKDNFSNDEWKELYKISEETFVEESESLKNIGAGAGLTDND